MGRGEWNRRTERGKQKIRLKMIELLDKVTDIQDDQSKILDLEESINDNISNLFECDLECTTCTADDRAKCMHNFRVANIFLMSKIMSYEEHFGKYLEIFADMIKDIGQDFLGLIEAINAGPESEDEEDQEDSKEEEDNQSLYS